MTTNTDFSEDQPSKTIGDFCEAESISLPAYFSLRRKGLGPEELRPPGTRIIRITAQAHHEWRARMQELAQSRQAKLEAARRRDQTVEAARRSVESRRAKAASTSPTSRRPRMEVRR